MARKRERGAKIEHDLVDDKQQISRRTFILGTIGGLLGLSGLGYIARMNRGNGGIRKKSEDVQSHKEIPQARSIVHPKMNVDAPVFAVKETDPRAAGRKIMEALKPKLSKKVMIKPNLGYAKTTDLGGKTTDPWFVAGIIDYLVDQGVNKDNIVIAEGNGYKKMVDVFEVTGYTAMAAEIGVALLDLNQDLGATFVKVDDKHYPGLLEQWIPNPVLDHYQNYTLLNVPKLKTHRFALLTLGMKNLMGTLLPYNRKWLMHRELDHMLNHNLMTPDAYWFAYLSTSLRLVNLHSIIRGTYTIVEGIRGSEGDGLDKVSIINSGVAFASENAVNLDTACAWFMGYDTMDMQVEGMPWMKEYPILKMAAEKGFGHNEISKIDLRGDKVEPGKRFECTIMLTDEKFKSTRADL